MSKKALGPSDDVTGVRRLALQLAVQLPADSVAACAVVDELREIVSFLHRPNWPKGDVVRLQMVSNESLRDQARSR